MENIPLEVLQQFVSGPTCRFRATCRRFLREIKPVPFADIDEIMQKLDLRTYLGDKCGVFDIVAREMVATIMVYHFRPMYFLLLGNMLNGNIKGIIFWDDSIAPYFTGARGTTLYKLRFYRYQPVYLQMPEKLYQYDGADKWLIVHSRQFWWTRYGRFEMADELNIPDIRSTEIPLCIYEKI